MRVELHQRIDQISQVFSALGALKLSIEEFAIARAEPLEPTMHLLVKGGIWRLGNRMGSIPLLEPLLQGR